MNARILAVSEDRIQGFLVDPVTAIADETELPVDTTVVELSELEWQVLGPLERVTRYNALFHWRVPEEREREAGREVGRHHILTHAYWREGGPEFAHVNIMAVAHGTEKEVVLADKAAIDRHLEEAGIPVAYTNVFWGGRSEIKPSEILPSAYEAFCRREGLDPAAMRA